MAVITYELLRELAPKVRGAKSKIQEENLRKTADFMEDAEKIADLSTNLRLSHFLAQIAHESDGFCATEEYASGKAYEGRSDLGNTAAGDGVRYKGRGLIQVTGKANYKAFSDWALKNLRDFYPEGVPDFIRSPEKLAQFPSALFSACWFWKTKKLNELADKDALTLVTKRINGGLNGFSDRRAYLKKAQSLLNGAKLMA